MTDKIMNRFFTATENGIVLHYKIYHLYRL